MTKKKKKKMDKNMVTYCKTRKKRNINWKKIWIKVLRGESKQSLDGLVDQIEENL